MSQVAEVPGIPMDDMTGPDRAQVKVLVCDDDAMFRDALSDLLKGAGFTLVGAATDATESVDMAGKLEPDVILMDLRMPGLDGIEATRQITAVLVGVKVIMLSAYDDPALTRSATENGAFCYLVKGCPPRMIHEVVLKAWAHDRA
jgi:DNA-binding NarL/FixJ family response regulator